MIGIEATLSSARTGKGRDDWQTPPKVLELVRSFAPLALDVATSPGNPVGAAFFCTEELDGTGLALGGLLGSWQGPAAGVTWCNPPYSTAKHWIAKAGEEAELGAEIIMLIASRTGAHYFAPVYQAAALCFVRGRLTFANADTGEPVRDGKGNPMPAPFDSAIVYWGNRPARFRRTFSALGSVVYPIRG